MARKLYEKYEVEWTDSASHNGWNDKRRERFPPLNCKSVGYLIEDSKDYMAFAQSISGNARDAAEIISIPKAITTKLRRIK